MTNPTNPPKRRILTALFLTLITSLGLLTTSSRPAAADIPTTAYNSYTQCNNKYVTGVGVSNAYDTISIFPNWAALSVTSTNQTWAAAYNCSSVIRNASPSVRNSLQAQLACHSMFNAGLSRGGYVWDLERYRPATWNISTWWSKKCNW